MAETEDCETDVTPELIGAGVKAADPIFFEWGSTPEGTLVSRVYLARDAGRRDHPLTLRHSEVTGQHEPHSLSALRS